MRTYIIAEAGVNHNGSLPLALALVDAAAASGADAVKFQTFQAADLVTRTAPRAQYQRKGQDEEDQFSLLRQLELTAEMHRAIVERCGERKIDFLSTPFDFASLGFLTRNFQMAYLKIASGEITNAPFLLAAAKVNLPIILSTGMSTMEEIEAALGVLAFGYTNWESQPGREEFGKAFRSTMGQAVLKEKVKLLHCTTEYPAPYGEVNLLAMDALAERFLLPVGYSDHTEGIAVSLAAVARGAAVVEKHFTLDRTLQGPDHKASLEPGELTMLVAGIRQIEEALGSKNKAPTASEVNNRLIARKSLVAARDIAPGEIFTPDLLAIKRPATGISPYAYWEWLGKRAERHYRKDELIQP